MKQAIAICLLLLILGCGQNRDETQGVHGQVIKTFSAATDIRLKAIWTMTAHCAERRGYVQSVPAPPNVVLVQGPIDCGGAEAVGCTEDATVWFTIDDGIFDQGVGIIAHEFVHVILHNIGIFGENHPAFSCTTIVEEEYKYSHFSFGG